jgi:hypothetical protein
VLKSLRKLLADPRTPETLMLLLLMSLSAWMLLVICSELLESIPFCK